MTKNKIALFLLAFVMSTATFAAEELDQDDFSTRPAKTGIPGVWKLFVENDGNDKAEVKVICNFGRHGLTERISVIIPANCMARPYIYDQSYIRRLTSKPERPQCQIVSVTKSSKWTRACPGS